MKLKIDFIRILALAVCGALYLPGAVAADGVVNGKWYYSAGDRAAAELVENADGSVEADFDFPGYATIYMERDRQTLRARREEFASSRLEFDVKLDELPQHPVRGNVFIKNKDGLWFQSQTIFELNSEDWQTLGVELSASARDLRPVGHQAAWGSTYAVSIHTLGLSIYGEPGMSLDIHCRNPRFSGIRIRPALSIVDWQFAESGETYQMLEGKFDLSREYFNPYDDEEIRIDVLAVSPDGSELRWPAYFTREYRREIHFNRERIVPDGKAYWAFRFTPRQVGTYRLRLEVEDNSEAAPVRMNSPWHRLEVKGSSRRGFVRICPDDTRYFEFCTGELFYPVGFNLHTVKDLRSEERLELGYLPDRGTYSYDEYFSAMAEHGVNSCEIWMAAWSYALEWTSSRSGYYGLGRYNLANAWGLDHILKRADELGIYVHLVLDNHGKLSSHCDPEWDNSPHNLETPFAVADGATLEQPKDFFSDEASWDYYRKRNRYIAGRWGAFTSVFGIELWSEIDLITKHKEAYNDGSSLDWHRKAVDQLAELNQGRHPVTTHTCGDYNHPLNHRKFYEMDGIEYVVGDAYRKETPFVEHMRVHTEKLKVFEKPLLITEYGGTPHAGSYSRLAADLHAGIWSSFFLEHAGTPFLWWHDFIHRRGHYLHFLGFSRFIKDIDPREKGFVHRDLTVLSAEGQPDQVLQCLSAGNNGEYYGWVFDKKLMADFVSDLGDLAELPPFRGRSINLEDIIPGTYVIDYVDTFSGETISSTLLYTEEDKMVLQLPDFRADLAFRVRTQNGGNFGIHSIIEPGKGKRGQ